MQGNLPEMFRPLLWAHHFEKIDTQKHQELIITQAINYGTLAHWRWVVRTFGFAEVRAILLKMPAYTLRAHVRKLVSLLFNIKEQEFRYAQRGTY